MAPSGEQAETPSGQGTSPPKPWPKPWAEAFTGLSQAVLSVEKLAAGLLMALLLGLILVNVVTRYMKAPLYWIDEASIFTMIWLGFVGASVMTRLRVDFAVTLISDQMSAKNAARLRALAMGLSLAFALGLVVMCWRWMDPLGISAAGFDPRAYAAETFNFLYTEKTQTLEWPSWLIYLVLPLFAATLTLHTAANLLEDLGLARPRPQIRLTNSAEEAL